MRTRSTQWTYLELPRSVEPPPIEPETSYLSVFLRTAHVMDVRRGLRQFYGAVNSSITMVTRSGADAQFIATLAPTGLQNVDPSSVNRLIQINQRLVGPVPYVGGDVEAEVGLFSVASSELAGPYLKLLESLSKTSTFAFIGVALPFVEPIKQGVQLLAGGSEGTALEIGFATVWRPLRAGWVVAARVPRTDERYSVDPDEGRLLDGAGRPVEDFPYLVLELSVLPTRDDWFRIPELAATYAELQREFRRGRPADVEDALVAFRRTALTCNDLLFDDALRLADRVRQAFVAIGPTGPQVRTSGPATALPELRSFSPFGV